MYIYIHYTTQTGCRILICVSHSEWNFFLEKLSTGLIGHLGRFHYIFSKLLIKLQLNLCILAFVTPISSRSVRLTHVHVYICICVYMYIRPQRTHVYRFIQLAIFSDYKKFIPLDSLVYTDHKFTNFLFYLLRREQNKAFKV